MIHRLYSLILCTAFCASLAQANSHGFTASPSLYVFDYAEYSMSDDFLDGETGILPGIHFAYQFKNEHFSVLAQYSEYGGNIDYDGHLLFSGLPHTTLTDTYLRFYNIAIYSPELNQIGHAFLRLGNNHWDRNILPSGSVGGTHEIYRWREVSAGFRSEGHGNRFNIWSEFSLLHTYKPDMDIFLPSETLTFSLGTHVGFRLETGRYFKASNNLEIGLSGFIEHWRFGASESKYSIDIDQLTSGQYTQIHEPYSESQHWGLRLNFRYQY